MFANYQTLCKTDSLPSLKPDLWICWWIAAVLWIKVKKVSAGRSLWLYSKLNDSAGTGWPFLGNCWGVQALPLVLALLVFLHTHYSPFALHKACTSSHCYLVRVPAGHGHPRGRCASRGCGSKCWWGLEAACPLCTEHLGRETETKTSKC